MHPILARLLLAVLSFTPAAFAAEEVQPKFAAPGIAASRSVDAASGYGQTLLGLVLVLVAIFAVAFVAKRLRGISSSGAHGIEVLSQASLGAKERAVIVRVDGERLLLGVASGQVTLLRALSPEPETPATPAVTSTQVANFAALLRRSLGK
ncbi:MAG: flagellar biosynthetic protein FliO [Steroidobacteraceae bacterium]